MLGTWSSYDLGLVIHDNRGAMWIYSQTTQIIIARGRMGGGGAGVVVVPRVCHGAGAFAPPLFH